MVAKVAAVQRWRWRQCGGDDGDVVTVFFSRGKKIPAEK
jgi:hypothetical protein